MEEPTVTQRPRRQAAKLISAVEKAGGFVLDCGCLAACSAVSLRRLMEWTSPEAVIELRAALTAAHDHPVEEPHSAE